MNEEFIVCESEPFTQLDYAIENLRLNMHENNVFKMIKRGNQLKAYLNGKLFSSCTYSNYDSDIFFPSLSVDQPDYSDSVFIKSISVKFQGSVYSNPY